MLSYPQFLILYLVLFSIMRVRETMRYEEVKEMYEPLALIEKYGRRQDDVIALRAVKIWRSLCSSNDRCEIIPPFKPLSSTYGIAGLTYRISTCLIAKNMSTVLINIFCSIFMNMVGKTNETVTTMKRTKCEGRNFFKRYKQIRSIARNGPWINFAFVREPADRFLSGFLHVCRDSVTGHRDCEGCFGDMKCVLRKAFEYSQRFLVDKNVDSHLFWHVSPQNWSVEPVFDAIQCSSPPYILRDVSCTL
ncbi:hypothetical protein Q1695_007010 [Nippostrongylus brasiliensis]|nr:hypothetical protein Q1695_007010 [Nippostrongylus brasiliensis]